MLALILGATMSLALRAADGSYTPLTQAPTIPTSGVVQLRARIDVPTAAPLRLRFSQYVEFVDARISAPDGTTIQESAGTTVPYASRAVPLIAPVIAIPSNMGRPITIDLRVTAEDQRFALPKLETNYPANPSSEPDSFYILTVGLLLGIALYHLVLFAALRDRNIGLYVAYLAGFILYEMTASGLAWRDLWPHASIPAIAALRVAALIVVLAVTAFSRSFLQSARNAPTADRCFLAAVAFTTITTIVSLVLPSTLAVTAIASDIGILLAIVTLTVAGFICLRRGVRSAGFFLIGFAGLFIGAIVKIVVDDIGNIQSGAHFYGIEIGVSFDAIVLALGLADRMRIDTRERERAQALASEQERLARTDVLTGVANRRSFDERLADEWHRAARHHTPIAVLMVDVDRFKTYNDTLGHLSGDVCLRQIAMAGAGAVQRAEDLFARYGGEEFAVILPGSTIADAQAVAQRILGAIEHLELSHPLGGTITVSIGLAATAASVRVDAIALLADADAALYRAKQRGGGCFETAP